jgi:Endonuclease I
MNSEVHHIYATDGYVNSKRSNFPLGEVASATFTSTNGSKLGSASSGINYTGTVFEPIDEFKGEFARAYFYMATRYENVIGTWQNNTTASNGVLKAPVRRYLKAGVLLC